MSKNTLLRTFPCFLPLDDFCDRNFCIMSTILGSISINNSLNQLHCLLSSLPVRLLFLHSPFCRLASQSLMICCHESPGAVEKLPDNINQAPIKTFMCGAFCICKRLLVNLSVPVFAPAPILYILRSR